MTDIGSVGAAAVTTIGTLAVVGMAAKAAGGISKNVGRMPKTKSNYRVLKGTRPRSSKRSSKKFSIWD